MTKDETVKRILQTGILPVVRARSSEEALHLAEAIKAGGIDIIELTMTVPGAVDVIRELSLKFGEDVMIGAGTVLDAETARACILAGARFVVSPALDMGTIELCNTYGVPVFPGALTPTEVLRAWRAGATMVKVFPASAAGGVSYIKALKGPLPQIPLVPTGGVSLFNAADFITAGASAVGAGSDLVAALSEASGMAGVTEKAKQYLLEIERGRMKMRTEF